MKPAAPDMTSYWAVFSLLLLLSGSNFSAVSSLQASFSGRDYIEYDLGKSKSMDNDRTELLLHFKTIHPNGLFLFSKGTTNDFLQLELKEGTIWYSANLGGIREFTIDLGKNLHDNQRHTVRVARFRRQTTLRVDDLWRTRLAEENLHELNLNTKLYVGGMDRYRDLQIIETQNYKGCMENVTFQKVNLLQGAKDNAKNFKTYGKPEFKCTKEPYVPITFLSRMSYVKVTLSKRQQDNNSFSTTFKFRTFLKDGFLFSRSAIRVKFHLELREGSLYSQVLTPNGTKTLLQLGSRLDDGEWHSVDASINGESGKLQVSVDGRMRSARVNKTSIMLAFANKSLLKIFAGRAGEDSRQKSFRGCMLNLKVDSHQLTLSEVSRRKYSVDTTTGSCEVTNRCSPDPCANEGKCSHDGRDFSCQCNVRYEGTTCQKSVYEATCQAYKRLGLRRDTYCLLNSKETEYPQPYTALCNVTGDKDRTYTIVSHNGVMKKTRIGSGKLKGKFLEHDITYSIPMQQIESLIERSAECRQYIRYDCHNSKLLNSGSPLDSKANSHKTHAYWRARDHSMQFYWGGAPPGSGKCACGHTMTCANKFTSCNCDSRRNSWLVDDGYLTDEKTLPVTQVAFRNKSAGSFYTLGPLECWGAKKGDLDGVTESDQDQKARKLLHVCPNIVPPTTASTAATTEQTTTVESSSQGACTTTDGMNNAACLNQNPSTNKVSPSKTNTETHTRPKVPTPKNVNAIVSGKREDSSGGDGLSVALTALLSCSLVVALLLTVKFGLPRVIVCIRSHSKRGEYVVPPAGVGYPARLMPLVTGRKSSFRGRLTHNHIEKHVAEGNGEAGTGMKSYWV